ncbi:MAG: endopeptidase La [Proteobacteria bacterium]|nr:endopeptidase La [Pseudomonadota bacterium]
MQEQSQTKESQTFFPLLPLRDVVIFPHMVIPLFVGRAESIKALEVAMAMDKQIFLVAQKDASVDSPAPADLYNIGTIATVLQLLHLPDGTVKVLVEGVQRARIIEIKQEKGYLGAELELVTDIGALDDTEVVVLMRSVLAQFEELIKLNKKIPTELLTSLRNIENPGNLADNIAAHLSIKIASRQDILEKIDIRERLELLHKLLSEELDLVEVEKRVQGRVKQQVEKSQRQYYLSEKIKAIQKELGEMEEGGGSSDEIKELLKKILEAQMPQEAKEKAEAELNKLKMMSPMSAEATVSRNYLDILIQVPWTKFSKTSHDLEKAEAILDTDHYGLKEVKERILEYLAVQQRVKKMRGPILCLVGPPGVGKTSLGQSIANATGREFVRISLGGVRDEAEIRGHRRTYIGALPGKIIQKLCKVKVRNPLFMLDEVDKMAMDFRGDPASALLEVLDPEQNFAFNDHYLEVDYDLSDVMFIATANSMDIPAPLLDRMEVIRLAGYTEQEKLNIAKKYLVPRQIKRSGLKKKELAFTDGAILEIIQNYTREAGVRNLDREISKLCRKVVKEIILKKNKKKVMITRRSIEKYLGVKRFRFGLAESENKVGQVTGLAWTEVGGELLTIEAQVVPGKGKSLQTGRLGDVMQESIQAAMTVVRSRAELFGIEGDYFQEQDFHVHVPEGATPKDGPSAGIAMCTALVSAITRIPVRADVAMTGEITLRGKVLPIGGLKEKLLAALRGGIKTVIIPEENRKDLKEIPSEVIHQIQIHPVQWIDEVLQLAMTSMPEPLIKVGAPRVDLDAEKEKKGKHQSESSTH